MDGSSDMTVGSGVGVFVAYSTSSAILFHYFNDLTDLNLLCGLLLRPPHLILRWLNG